MKLKIMIPLLLSCYASLGFANSHWLFRLRAVDVIPFPSSNRIAVVGGNVDEMSSQVVPEVDISYFFTDYISAELILGTMRHSVAANNTIIGHVDLGKVNLLPPTVTFQYNFMPDRQVSPYLGVGINYTYFYKISDGPVSLGTSYGDSFGPALQAGINVALNAHWSLNADVKKIYIQTNASVDTLVGQLTPTVKINPVIVGAGIGYRT